MQDIARAMSSAGRRPPASRSARWLGRPRAASATARLSPSGTAATPSAWEEVLDRARNVDDSPLRARADAVRPTDTALIMYTSGTTGFPRGVMRDDSLLESTVDRLERLGTTERDVVINYLPLFHIFGYVDGPLGTLVGGHRQVLTD